MKMKRVEVKTEDIPAHEALEQIIKDYGEYSYTPTRSFTSIRIDNDYDEERDEDREDDDENNRKYPVAPSMRHANVYQDSISVNTFNDYLNKNDISDLLKYLIRVRLLHESSSPIGFDPNLVQENLDVLRQKQSKHIASICRSYCDSIEAYAIPRDERFIMKTLREDMTRLMEDIHLLPYYKKIFFTINSRDILTEIMKGCVLRNIKVDPLLRTSKIDFEEIRRNNSLIKVAYFGNINELFLVDQDYTPLYVDNYMYGTFEMIPIVAKDAIEPIVEEMVTINGKEFPKNIVENMIECSFDNFIENLEVEKFLSSLNPERIGDGNITSLKDITLL